MSALFSITDLVPAGNVPKNCPSLQVTDSSPSSYKVFRVFVGDVEIKNNITCSTVIVKDNIFSTLWSVRRPTYNQIAKYISDDITSKNLNSIISNRRFANSNRKFYEELFDEIASARIAGYEGRYSKAFMHIYRVLERISYVYPMIFANKTTDFQSSFNYLKSFFNKQDKGELGFLRRALSEIFRGSMLVSMTFDIDLSIYDSYGVKEDLSKLYSQILKSEWLDPVGTCSDKIALKFLNVGDAIVTIRNQVCHSLTDEKKLVCSQFYDMDLFFQSSYPVFLQWIGVLFVQIFKINYNYYSN